MPLIEAAEIVLPPARSFRDPAGFTFREDGRFLRAVRPAAFDTLSQFLSTPLARNWMESGRFVETHPLNSTVEGYQLVEHERIAFPSFPEEWPPEMLHAAGALTINLAEEALAEGFELKDATPYNVLFRGPKPIMVDALSIEKRDPADMVWRPFAQFVRTFLLPLAADRYGLRPCHQVFMASREGLEPREIYAALSWLRRLASPWLSLVSLPVWLASGERVSIYGRKGMAGVNPGAGLFVLHQLLASLRRKLSRVSPRAGRTSAWSGYLAVASPYREEHLQTKMAFVEAALRESKPRHVLDVGCNTGRFSEMAARCGAEVVGIDSDAAAVGALWRRANAASLPILPLVVDLARPTPSTGWRNLENASFLDRAAGQFNAVLLLAVVHHLLITSRIPLDQLLALAAQLTTDWLIVEWVEPGDAMFQRLVRGRQELYAHLTSRYFETSLAPHFRILRRQPIEGAQRVLYLLRKSS
jgi:SAM-dependent methyltransferase